MEMLRRRAKTRSGRLKGQVIAEDETRGSRAWMRQAKEKFRLSGRTQTGAQPIHHFGKEVVDLSSPSAKDKVYNTDMDRKMFFGERDVVLVPEKAQKVFKTFKGRLEMDLDRAWKAIEPKSTSRSVDPRNPGHFISELVELRMSGRSEHGPDGHVDLVPTIWVRCSEEQMESMKKALDDTSISWIHTTKFGRIMLGEAAMLLSRDASSHHYEIPVGRGIPLGPNLLDGITLHLEIEDVSARTSVEGMFFRATLMKGGVVRSQKLSTIGGVLNVGGRPVGVTSAHGILGNIWDAALSKEGELLPGVDPIAGETSEHDRNSARGPNKTLSSGGSSEEDDLSCYAKFTRRPPQPSTPPPRKWIEVELGDVANFLGLKAIMVKVDDGVPSTVVFIEDVVKSDFALVRLDNISNHLRTGGPPLSTSVLEYETSNTITPGPVLIRLGDREVEGTVLAHPASLKIFGISLSTQYVRLPQPLPLGSSGAWVVRDNLLCGMIIAGYDHEPYAHMIPASRFVGDIKKSIHDTSGITTFKGSLASYFLEDNSTASASAAQENSLPPPDTPTAFTITSSAVAPSHVTAPRPPPAAALTSTRQNDLGPESESTQSPVINLPQAPPDAKRINRLWVLKKRLTGSVQQTTSSFSHQVQIELDRLHQFVQSRRTGPTISDPYDTEADHEGTRYTPNSPQERTREHIYEKLDTQGFNGPIALLAALEYLASWYNLFAVYLATSSIDFVHSNPELPASDWLGSGSLSGLVVLIGMSVGMFASGLLATFFGSLEASSFFLVVLLSSIICMLAIDFQGTPGPVVVWQFFMGLGIGSSSLFPAISVVECASTKTRSAMLAIVLSMQGFAQLFVHGLGALILSGDLPRGGQSIFDTDRHAVEQTWRIVIGLGAVPVAATIFLRLFTDVPESPRYLLTARNDPQLAVKAVESLLKHSWARQLFFGWRGFMFFTSLWPKLFHGTSGNTKRQGIGQRLSGLYHYLFRNDKALGRQDRYFRLVGWSTVSWLLLNVAFFGMGLDNPQGILFAWGITSPDSTLDEDRPHNYIQAANAKALLQSWIIVLQFLSGPAVLGYLVRIYLVRYVTRRVILRWSSFLTVILLAVFGAVLYPRQSSENGDGLFVLIVYSIFQFAMSFAPSALQFAFAAEVINTRYRTALLGTCSALAMLGAVGVRALVAYVDVFKTRLSYSAFLSAGAVAGSGLVLLIFVPHMYTYTEKRLMGTRRLVTRRLEYVTGERGLVHGDSEFVHRGSEFEMDELR